MLIANLDKWWQTFITGISKLTAYKFNFFLQVTGPAFVFLFVKYSLWNSVYQGDSELIIQGYSYKEMINYHLFGLVVSQIAEGHRAMDLAEEIRMGRISNYLIYPFNFWEYHTANFFSFQFIQSVIALITLYFINIFTDVSFTFSSALTALSYCYFVSLFWFSLQYLTGILGFWLEETWILRVILMIVSGFLSGAIIPLELYPEWMQSILHFTPFPYLAYFPIKLFSGADMPVLRGVITMSAWLFVIVIINRHVWKKGIRNYTAAGM